MSDPRDNAVEARREAAREHELRAWSLRVRGWTQAAIAADLGMSRTGVRNALNRAEKRVLAQCEGKVKRIKARQTAQLEYLLYETMQAWERSKLPGRKRRVKTTAVRAAGPKGQSVELPGRELTVDLVERDGDPRWIGEALAVLAAERAVWGVGRPDDADADLGTWDDIDLQVAAHEERLAGLPPAERRARLEFRAAAARRELAQIEQSIAETSDPEPEAEAHPDGQAEA